IQALLNRDFRLEPEQASRYAGFNLIVFRQAQRLAQHMSNSDETAVKLHRGTGSISNGRFSAKWPKQQALESAINKAQHLDEVDWLEAAWTALSDQSQPDPLHLPDTGVGLLRERELAPVFINTPSYGTRQSTVIKLSSKGHLKIWERRWTGHGAALRHSDVFWNNKHD
ncbi:MAG: NRDE family protein, partial [Burkholderiaceae bacterium]